MIERALRLTIDYVKERKAFGKAIIDFQNTQFELAECKSEATIGSVFHDHCVERHLARSSIPSPPRWRSTGSTDLQNKIVDRCLQLFGGYGYHGTNIPDLAHVPDSRVIAHLRRNQRDHEASDARKPCEIRVCQKWRRGPCRTPSSTITCARRAGAQAMARWHEVTALNLGDRRRSAAVKARNNLDPSLVDDVRAGCSIPSARPAATSRAWRPLTAGYGNACRACRSTGSGASGLVAVNFAADAGHVGPARHDRSAARRIDEPRRHRRLRRRLADGSRRSRCRPTSCRRASRPI
jgi:hypothetical protein